EITARFESELRDNNASISRIVRELSLVAFCDPGKMLDESGHLRPLHELPEEVRHGLLGVTLTEYRSENGEKPARIVQKFRFDKLTALNLLVKHYGMVTNNLA